MLPAWKAPYCPVPVAVGVAVGDDVAEAVGDGVAPELRLAVGLGDGVPVLDGDPVDDAVWLGDGVDVRVADGVAAGPACGANTVPRKCVLAGAVYSKRTVYVVVLNAITRDWPDT
jgi:hypothetical protein